MPVSRGYPKGSGGTVSPVIGGLGGSSEGTSDELFDASSIVSGLYDISAALAQTPKEVMTALAISAGQGLVILAAPDYRAYFDLTAYSGSILKVMNTGTLKVYGDLTIDNECEAYFDNGSIITIKGE